MFLKLNLFNFEEILNSYNEVLHNCDGMTHQNQNKKNSNWTCIWGRKTHYLVFISQESLEIPTPSQLFIWRHNSFTDREASLCKLQERHPKGAISEAPPFNDDEKPAPIYFVFITIRECHTDFHRCRYFPIAY